MNTGSMPLGGYSHTSGRILKEGKWHGYSFDEIKEFLKSDSPYNEILCASMTVVIDKDLVVPKGKTLFVLGCTLKVSKGATLTIKGDLIINEYTHLEVEGTVIGEMGVGNSTPL